MNHVGVRGGATGDRFTLSPLLRNQIGWRKMRLYFVRWFTTVTPRLRVSELVSSCSPMPRRKLSAFSRYKYIRACRFLTL